MKSIFDTGFLFFHFGFGGGTYVDFGDTACQLCQPLLELLAIVVACRVVNFATKLIDTRFDICTLASTFDNGRVVLIDDHLLGHAQVRDWERLELDTQRFKDGSSASENCNVFHHRFATVAVTWCLDGDTLEGASQAVDH